MEFIDLKHVDEKKGIKYAINLHFHFFLFKCQRNIDIKSLVVSTYYTEKGKGLAQPRGTYSLQTNIHISTIFVVDPQPDQIRQ